MTMAFWSGEKLSQRLNTLIVPFDQEHIDCAAYTLCLGEEAFVTDDKKGPPRRSSMQIKDKEYILIPPGQFAFLLTKESVKVPNDAIAFISMKAKYKFKGLINVSGFHVDPGWEGKLIFGVYNAGSKSIGIKYGSELFLIWYSDLDRNSSKVRPRTTNPQMSIPTQLIDEMDGHVFSPISLEKKIHETNGKITNVRVWIAGVGVGLALIATVAFNEISNLQSIYSGVEKDLAQVEAQTEQNKSRIDNTSGPPIISVKPNASK